MPACLACAPSNIHFGLIGVGVWDLLVEAITLWALHGLACLVALYAVPPYLFCTFLAQPLLDPVHCRGSHRLTVGF